VVRRTVGAGFRGRQPTVTLVIDSAVCCQYFLPGMVTFPASERHRRLADTVWERLDPGLLSESRTGWDWTCELVLPITPAHHMQVTPKSEENPDCRQSRRKRHCFWRLIDSPSTRVNSTMDLISQHN